MKKFRLVSFAIAVLLVITSFAGCGAKPDSKEKSEVNSAVEQKEEKDANKSSKGIKLTCEKIGSFNSNGGNSLSISVGGISYYLDGKYGVISLDGKKDTGAVYHSCEASYTYFKVSKITPNIDDLESYNSKGLIDGNGNVIIPEEYFLIDILNEQYAKVVKISEVTENKDEAVAYLADKMLSLFPDDADTFFKGEWLIYDLNQKKPIEGVRGIKGSGASACGTVLRYDDDKGYNRSMNEKGEELPKDANVYAFGSYSVESKLDDTWIAKIYDSYGNELFNYNSKECIIVEETEKYFIMKSYEPEKKYIVDKKGNKVSGEFDSSYPFEIHGDVVFSENKIYDINGKSLSESEYKFCRSDEQTGKYLYLQKEEGGYDIMSDRGELICQIPDDGEYEVYYDVLSKGKGDNEKFYSFKDNDFTIEGYDSISYFLIETENDDFTSGIVDTTTNKTIIEGYKDIETAIAKGSAVYVLAESEDNSIDVYEITFQ